MTLLAVAMTIPLLLAPIDTRADIANAATPTKFAIGPVLIYLAGYFLFGAGYIAYMTFVVAWMVSHGASALDVALTWGTLGIATMLAPIATLVVWTLLDLSRTGRATARWTCT